LIFLKIGGVILIILIPVFLTILILMPVIKGSRSQKYADHYQLKEGFTAYDIDQIVDRMSQDHEFYFYFLTLSTDSVAQAVDEVQRLLNQNRGREALDRLLVKMMAGIEAEASQLSRLSYPEDFSSRPQNYPEITQKMWNFIYEEFKLAIVGVCYKASYDTQFQFRWQSTTAQMAVRLKDLLLTLTTKQREELGQRFSPAAILSETSSHPTGDVTDSR
jgi:hypothetical protein